MATSITVDKKAGTVTIVLPLVKGEPPSKTGKMRTLASTGGFATADHTDGHEKQLKMNVFVGYSS